MNKTNIYSDFYFNGKRLSEMGGTIIEQYDEVTNGLPVMDDETINIPGQDGEILLRTSYKPREWGRKIFFEDVNVREVSSWLGCEEEKDFYFVGDDVKIKAKIPNGIDFGIYSNNEKSKFSGIIEVSFIAYNPFYSLIKPLSYDFSTVGVKNIANKGNRKSFPKFKFNFNGTQNITFRINNVEYQLKAVKDWCEIDTIKRKVIDSTGSKRTSFLCNGKRVLDFPEFNPGTNTFELKLGTTNVHIECNSRFI